MTERFEILEGIARGGMAEVYRARVVDPDGRVREVCVKKILPHLVTDRQSLDMFIGEAQLAATLTCPQIVQVYDLCVSHDSEYFIVMEYVDGLDLARLTHAVKRQEKTVPTRLVARIAVELCRGLGYAHSRRNARGDPLHIVHRDVSPQNVLVSRDGDVKITDFGIAKSSLRMATTAIGVLKGKYGYMSPEQANGRPLDHRSDLFNVGILLYELLTLRRCFAGASDFSTLRLMRHAEVVPPRQVCPDTPPELERLILKALSVSPEDRFQSAQELVNALLVCPGVELGSRDELATWVRGLAEATSEPTRENTGVLTLSSVVHRAGRAPTEVDPTAPAAPVGPASKTPGRRRAAWAFAAAGAAVGAGVASWCTLDPGPDARVKAARSSSRGPRTPTAVLLFDTDPAGARVFLDGIELAGKTPVVVERPPDDRTHQVRFVHPDRIPRTREISWADRPLTRLRVELEPRTPEQPDRGRLVVRSFPAADVWVDGEPAGTSDGSEMTVSAGVHRIEVRTAAGLRGRPVTVEVPAGKRREVWVELEPFDGP
jgi:serine/threonine protein kinase